MKHKFHKSFDRNPTSIIQIYCGKNVPKFRKLLVSRVNQKDKRLKTQITNKQKTISVSQSFNNSYMQLNDKQNSQNPQINNDKNIKDYVKDMNYRNYHQKTQKYSRILSPKQKSVMKTQINQQVRNKHVYSSFDKNQQKRIQDIAEIDNQIQQILQKKLDRFKLKTTFTPLSVNDRSFNKYNDHNILNKSLSLKKSKLEQLPQNDVKVQKKLQSLVDKLRNLQSFNMDKKDISFYDHKILLLEKIIAQNSAQSEIAKKYYFETLAQKKRFQSKIKKFPTPQKIKIPPLKKYQKYVFTQSINQSSYKKPKKQDYDIYRYKHQPFRRNPQPFPKSTYHLQYIGYHGIPITNSYKDLQNSSYGPDNHRDMKSIYSNDFHKMQADKINFKQLDCYKDKFKNLQVSYAKLKQKNSIDALKNDMIYLKQNTIPKKVQIIPKSNTLLNKQLLISQTQRQFKGFSAGSSVIKHKQLSKLKYSYKNIIHG